MTTADPITFARKLECEEDGLYFSRYFFKQRMGAKMIVAPHHKVIQKTLDRVLSGEIKRLIINVPPGYTKTELATINMIGRGLALNPRARFLHLSYSHDLALLNSSTARAMVKSKAYQSMWPMALKDDADSKSMWWTEHGGGVYATSSKGQVTGFRAGHMEPGWNGCFPAGTIVETECGPRAIDEIIANREKIRVWSFNHKKGCTELQPVIGWWKNPQNSIVEVSLSDGTVFECTPDHKIYTENRGYVRADSLLSSDMLPSYAPHAFDLSNGDAKSGSKLLSGNARVKQNIIANCVHPFTAWGEFFAKLKTFRYGSPCHAIPNLANYAHNYAVPFGDGRSWLATEKNSDSIISSEFRARSALEQREGSMPLGVGHVFGFGSPCKIVSPIVERVSVKVSPFVARLLGPIKRRQDKLVNITWAHDAIFRKAYSIVPAPIKLWFEKFSRECVPLPLAGDNLSVKASDLPEVADFVDSFVTGYRNPVLVRHVRHVDNSYCLTVRCNSNFILSSGKVLVHNCLLIDDPVKPDDAFSELVRDGVNNRFNETIKSRLAIESTPLIVIMQRIHYNDLSGYLLRGGSGEKWHHLNLPVIIDNSATYPEENTHGIPIDHGLPDGWLWEYKHNETHRVALTSHRRTFQAQYMQNPPRFNAEGALWSEKMIAAARVLEISQKKQRTVVAIDPAVSTEEKSDESGIVVATSYGVGDSRQFSVDGDYSGKYSPAAWAKKAMFAYEQHSADAIVIETNQGGDMVEDTLRNAGYRGRVIRVHASKGKYARAEPISALYEQGRVRHNGNLYELENQCMEYVPSTAKKSPDRLDALVWAITELSGGTAVGILLRR